MTALREHIGHAQASLWEISKHFDEADTAQDRRAALGSACMQSEARLASASAELKASQDALRGLQGQLKAKGAVLEDQRNRSNATLDEQIARAQAEWAVLNDNIKKKRQAIADTEASAQSLIKRLSLG